MKKMLLLTVILVGAAAGVSPLVKPTAKLGERGRAAAARPVSRAERVGNLPVTVKGVTGQSLRIYNSQKLTSLEQIDTYVLERRGKLRELAQADPVREIEVAVSPSRKLSLEELGKKSRQYGLTLNELSLDIFVDGKWDRVVWFDKTTAVLNISDDAQTMARRIIEVESSRPSGHAGEDGSDLTALPAGSVGLSVRFARASLQAEMALRLQDDQSIMLVDPVTDLQDAFKGQADEVRVSRMPHLYVERELQFGSTYSPQNRYRAAPERGQPDAR